MCIEGESRVAIFVRYINLLVNRLQGYLAQKVMGLKKLEASWSELHLPLGPPIDLHEVQNAKLPPERRRRRQYWRQYCGRCLRSRGRCAQTLLQDGRTEERKSGERKRKKEIPRARQSMCMWFTRKEPGSVCSFPKTNYIHECLKQGCLGG